MTVSVECNDEPFEEHVIQLPWYDEEVAERFWPAVNAPTYRESADKAADLVNYVYERAFRDGVRSILGRDS